MFNYAGKSFAKGMDETRNNQYFEGTEPRWSWIDHLLCIIWQFINCFRLKGFLQLRWWVLSFTGIFSSLVVKLFALLEYLLFYDTSNGKEWTMLVEKDKTFSMLRELSFCCCDKLTGDLPFLPSSFTKLRVCRSPQLASSIPRMPVISKLKLSNHDNLIPKEMEYECASHPSVLYNF